MKPIVTNISTFPRMIENGNLYVDKTSYLRKLVDPTNGGQFFLARPRRFGKSLTISTLQAIFEGRRDLFKGLAIDKSDYDWQKYPVIRLDMSTAQAETLENFYIQVLTTMRLEAERIGLTIETTSSLPAMLQSLIAKASKISDSGKVVLLIDEYDKPLLGHLCRPTVEAFRSELKAFYSVIKASESLLRFSFITGVSKFSKVSIFSDLNNLVDLTMSAEYATLLGYTHEEVLNNFGEQIAALGAANGMTSEQAFQKIVKMYDGYRFHFASKLVINPVSLGRCLASREFNSYWYETGTPTFLVEMLKVRPMDLTNLVISADKLGTYEPSNPEVVPLLFQTGYLTIRNSFEEDETRYYTLCFPNTEVEKAFCDSLAPVYTGHANDASFDRLRLDCRAALREHDINGFFEAMQPIFANIPYDLTDRQNEQTWQAIIVVIMRFLGLRVIPEDRTNRGRIDFTVDAGNEFYVVEMKLDKPAKEALEQIKKNGYAEKFAASGKRITLVGLSFDSKKRTVSEYCV